MRKFYWRPHEDSDEIELLGEFRCSASAVAHLKRMGAPEECSVTCRPYHDGELVEVRCTVYAAH